jgi:hypothetical protein
MTTIRGTSGNVSGTATLTVTAVTTTGSVHLAWTAPTTYTDGTPQTDLTGYKIYYGTSSGNYTTSIDIGNVTSYTLTNLATGTYFISVTAYDSSRIESNFSNEVTTTIQ